jgi:hypothetical protein
MKKILLLSTTCLFIFSCANNADKTATSSSDTTKVAASSTTTPAVDYPYTATYSSQMEVGDPNNSKKILEIYKDYDNGNLLAHKEYFADSIAFDLASGNTVMGTRDSILNTAQKERNNMKSVEDKIITFVPSHAKDKGENWVSVWTKEIDTHKDGKIDSTFLNENWMFNKDGKISYMVQLSAKAAPPKEAKKK